MNTFLTDFEHGQSSLRVKRVIKETSDPLRPQVDAQKQVSPYVEFYLQNMGKLDQSLD
jgi:hypothetical protein